MSPDRIKNPAPGYDFMTRKEVQRGMTTPNDPVSVLAEKALRRSRSLHIGKEDGSGVEPDVWGALAEIEGQLERIISLTGGTTCCGYHDWTAVMWNPFNKVVQCHNCGHVWQPASPSVVSPPCTCDHDCGADERGLCCGACVKPEPVSEPQTVAGPSTQASRDLVLSAAYHVVGCAIHKKGHPPCDCGLPDALWTVEAEARAIAEPAHPRPRR